MVFHCYYLLDFPLCSYTIDDLFAWSQDDSEMNESEEHAH